MGRATPVVSVAAMALVACGGSPDTEATTAPTDPPGADPGDDAAGDRADRYPDVIGVVATRADDGTWTFDVTISSPYDTPERYADGWRVLGPDGEVFGEHELLHDHAGEQPFTRTQRGVAVPDDVTEVTVEGRDQRYGYGGETVTVLLVTT